MLIQLFIVSTRFCASRPWLIPPIFLSQVPSLRARWFTRELAPCCPAFARPPELLLGASPLDLLGLRPSVFNVPLTLIIILYFSQFVKCLVDQFQNFKVTYV